MEEWQCDLVKDFINDNSDVSLVYVISGRDDSCEQMIEFIQEMQMESKFYIYCNIRANSN
jgi:hypothetical protein